MTDKGAKKKRPAPTAGTAGTCLTMISIGSTTMSKVKQHLHLVNCFQEGMLEFDCPMGQCLVIFPTVSQRGGWGGGEEERYGIDWKNKSL